MPLRLFRSVPAVLAILLAISAAAPGVAEDHAAEINAKVSVLASANNIDQTSLKPWKMRISYTLRDAYGAQVVAQGTAEETWISPENSRITVVSPTYRSGDVSGPATANRERSLVRELLAALVHPVQAPGEKTGLQMTQETKEMGSPLDCLRITMQLHNSPFPLVTMPVASYCTTPQTNRVRVILQGAENIVRAKVGLFQGVAVGTEVELGYNGTTIITGHVEQLDTAVTATEPAPPDVIDTRQHVPGAMTAGAIQYKQQPVYPEEAKRDHINGTVVIAGIIGKDGTISSLEVMASTDKSLSTAATEAVRHWKYRPYLLNGQPVEVDTTITVNFHMSASIL